MLLCQVAIKLQNNSRIFELEQPSHRRLKLPSVSSIVPRKKRLNAKKKSKPAQIETGTVPAAGARYTSRSRQAS